MHIVVMNNGHTPLNASAAPPRVSVIMANYNGAAHIAAAVRSVLRQTETLLELVLSDDGSDDDSLACAEAAAEGDPRLVIIRGGSRTGPAATRNRALALARGAWIAVVDNDDYIHPERLERLLAAAERDGADIAADDLLTFYQNEASPPHAHLRGALAKRPHWISAAAYERSNRLLSGHRALGYLKPIFRRSFNARYNEDLRIGEDSDLILRLLVGGARMRIYPELGYFYRKHAASISHRLDVDAIAAFDAAYATIDAGADRALAKELQKGAAARADARAFTKLVAALKTRNVGAAFSALIARPTAALLLREPLAARLRKRRISPAAHGQRRITLLSRQRIVGATNGSSAYVIALAQALKREGFSVSFLGISPRIFGRWAMLRLRPELKIFDRYMINGGWRVGGFVLARDPRVWAASALALIDLILRRLGFPANLSEPAAYDKAAPATRDDALFIARHSTGSAQAVFCDYAFMAPYAAFALNPEAPALVIMHDLLSGRVTDSNERNITELSADTEYKLLGMADGVIAIQRDEAARVRAALPQQKVIVVPHPANVAATPQPGEDDTLLFVGSNTAPNIVGLEWFFRTVWPAVRAARPKARLKVAGSVARALGSPPEGVAMLGVVADLHPLYAEAGIVISPLRTGSGLKIKLIEALGAGKAVVGCTVTAQGVETEVAGALMLEDDPARFATAVIGLLADQGQRRALAARALAAAERHFAPSACFDGLLTFLRPPYPRAPSQKTLPEALSTAQ